MNTLNNQQKLFSNSKQSLSTWVDKYKRSIVFTNGCFDILHRGHVDYLEKAAALGESLLVGINSDDSVKLQNKGPDRPVNSQADRAAILCALACVDGVVIFHQATPLELIMEIRPDVLVKGGDWPVEKIVGAQEVIDSGGTVHSIEFEFQRSTTDLIERIRQL